MENKKLPVAIIGGGPVGLAAAAHLVKRGESFVLFEAGETAGANVLNWAHVRVFSPWKYNIDKAAKELLEQSGWKSPDENGLPTGKELYDHYFKHLVNLPTIHPHVHTNSMVMAIGRKGLDKMKSKDREKQPFVIQVKQNGVNKLVEARAVIDASGTWQNSNPVGSGGMLAFGEADNKAWIYYGIPDVLGIHKERYHSKNVLVVGGGHSAINTILELEKLKQTYPGTEIHWVLRKKNIKEAYGGQEDDALPARGELGIKIERMVNEDKVSIYTPFQIDEILKEDGKLAVYGTQQGERKALRGIDEIISNTGTRPDLSFLKEVRVDVDSSVESVPALADLIDPNIHSCGTVRPHGEAELRQKEKDLYVVGIKSYGRAPTFLMATGYEQVRSVVAALTGDWEAAKKVELDLPETGVCSTGGDNSQACCGTGSNTEKKAAKCC